jgi:hypothetical protein
MSKREENCKQHSSVLAADSDMFIDKAIGHCKMISIVVEILHLVSVARVVISAVEIANQHK